LSVPFGCPLRANSRTSPETREQQLEKLIDPLMEPSIGDLVAQFKGIMERCNGSKKPDKPKTYAFQKKRSCPNPESYPEQSGVQPSLPGFEA